MVPLADLDHRELANARDDLGALVLLAGTRRDRALLGQVRGAHVLRRERVRVAADVARRRRARRVAVPAARQARRVRLAPHLPRADRDELDFFLRYTTENSMVQAACEGEEFSVDVFSDLDARCVAAIPRTMIESKGGESIKGMSIKDAELMDFARRVADTLGIIGPANIQCFREPSGELQVTDVNPRFGGGFPLPRQPGRATPRWLSRSPRVRASSRVSGIFAKAWS